MLGDRHQLDVREPERCAHGRRARPRVAPRCRRHDATSRDAPRTHAAARFAATTRTALGHPFTVAPVVIDGDGDHARVARRELGLARHRVGFAHRSTIAGRDLELVPVPAASTGHDGRPDPGRDIGLDTVAAPEAPSRSSRRRRRPTSRLVPTPRIERPTLTRRRRRGAAADRAAPTGDDACPHRTGADRAHRSGGRR